MFFKGNWDKERKGHIIYIRARNTSSNSHLDIDHRTTGTALANHAGIDKCLQIPRSPAGGDVDKAGIINRKTFCDTFSNRSVSVLQPLTQNEMRFFICFST